jgi:hypothetical protein
MQIMTIYVIYKSIFIMKLVLLHYLNSNLINTVISYTGIVLTNSMHLIFLKHQAKNVFEEGCSM